MRFASLQTYLGTDIDGYDTADNDRYLGSQKTVSSSLSVRLLRYSHKRERSCRMASVSLELLRCECDTHAVVATGCAVMVNAGLVVY